jgi:hypothetical protein
MVRILMGILGYVLSRSAGCRWPFPLFCGAVPRAFLWAVAVRQAPVLDANRACVALDLSPPYAPNTSQCASSLFREDLVYL